MKKIGLIFIVGLLLITSSPLYAQENKDHPILSRFKGSALIKTQILSFEEFNLPLGKVVKVTTDEGKEKHEFEKSKMIEGRITRKLYKPESDKTVYEIYKNYLATLEQRGAEILFKGRKGEETGPHLGNVYYRTNPMSGAVYNNTLPWGYLVVEKSSRALIVAKISGNTNDYYISIILGHGYEPYTVYQLDIIEVKAMDKNMVTAMSIKDDLDQNGHATIYGIHFDTGNSEIKIESDPTIKEIAEFLNNNPTRKIYIVGHTDHTGDFSANMTLSENRAKSVINELITKYNVKAEQLGAYGVSSLAPVTSNTTDEGKAKNRRVEIVEQ